MRQFLDLYRFETKHGGPNIGAGILDGWIACILVWAAVIATLLAIVAVLLGPADDLAGLDLRGKVAVRVTGSPFEIAGALAAHYQSSAEGPLDSDRPSHGRPLHVLSTGHEV